MIAINCLRAGASAVQLVMLYETSRKQNWQEAKQETPGFLHAIEAHEGEAVESLRCSFDDVHWILTITRETPPLSVKATIKDVMDRDG